MYDRVQVHGMDRSIIKMIVKSKASDGSQGVKLSQHKYATKGNGWIVPQKVSNGWARKWLKIIGTILIFKIEVKVRD